MSMSPKLLSKVSRQQPGQRFSCQRLIYSRDFKMESMHGSWGCSIAHLLENDFDLLSRTTGRGKTKENAVHSATEEGHKHLFYRCISELLHAHVGLQHSMRNHGNQDDVASLCYLDATQSVLK
ncbi:uncharacterized protein LOC112272486 [Brachypodium distachyon]|uniref:uncharacterized protein LOC112272486 n=1 Tax=Brachypodium distachyon TaxID=15368 RepID=UPI000D0D49B6|nr:uncharacterized protein LOC112272486 [Brachypodium distachyon]|eukprot:XP_024319169.1 uncharacterized protein LOC112272486 [Brachypodium distachyon]